MPSPTALIRRFPVLTYFALTFAISWGGVLLVIGGPSDMTGVKAQDNPLFPYVLLAMVAGPSVSGLLLTMVADGRAGLRLLLARLLKWRADSASYAVALLAAPVLATTIVLTLSLISPDVRSILYSNIDPSGLLAFGLIVALIAGVFEELGWTGFAIPHLRGRHGLLATGLIVGVLWSAWHFLVVAWGIGDRSGSIPLPVFMAIDSLGVLPVFRVLMVWVYDRTESLFVAILMHFSITATTLLATPQVTGGLLLLSGIVFAVALWLFMAAVIVGSGRHRKTDPFRDDHGEVIPGSIAEVRYLRLGGVDQWVMIRGTNVANPPLIQLHGGPGFPDIRMFRRLNAPLEQAFTVVSWDQRGTGKSYDASIPPSSMTVQQFLNDLDELVDYVRGRFGHQKVVLFGHSWGSVLGALYASRFPQKVSVYIGGAQIGDWSAAEAASYARAVAEAARLGNRKVLDKLRAIGAPPYSGASVFIERFAVQQMEGAMTLKALWSIFRVALATPESSIFEVQRTWRAFHFTLETMWPAVSQLNLRQLVPALEMPVFFFLGRRDRWVMPETSVAYFDALEAPVKELVWFEASGHQMFADEPEKFNATMVNVVRPVVIATRGRDGRSDVLVA